MTWVTILRLLLSLANTVATYVRDRKLLEQGEANAILAQLKGSVDALDRATKARDAATAKFDDTGGVPDEQDPNLRD